MSRRPLLLAALALALAVPSWSAAQTAPAPNAPAPPVVAASPADPHAAFAGSYVFAGGGRERTGLDQAIDRATDGMFFIARPIASGRLHDKNPVYAGIGFAFPPGQIQLSMATRPTMTGRDDGTPFTVTINNEAVTVTLRWQGNHVVQTLTTADGRRVNEFSLSPDGRLLTMTVSLHAGALPRDLHYSLSYTRR